MTFPRRNVHFISASFLSSWVPAQRWMTYMLHWKGNCVLAKLESEQIFPKKNTLFDFVCLFTRYCFIKEKMRVHSPVTLPQSQEAVHVFSPPDMWGPSACPSPASCIFKLPEVKSRPSAEYRIRWKKYSVVVLFVVILVKVLYSNVFILLILS